MSKRVSFFLVLLVAAAGKTSFAATAPSWCSPSRPFVREFNLLPGVHIQFLSRQAIHRATRMLSRRTIIRLDLATYRRLLSGGSEPAQGRYFYLARGGVMAPVELSDAQIPAYAEDASFAPYDDLVPGSLQIASLMTSENRQRPRNYPLLIVSPHPISRVSAMCMGGR